MLVGSAPTAVSTIYTATGLALIIPITPEAYEYRDGPSVCCVAVRGAVLLLSAAPTVTGATRSTVTATGVFGWRLRVAEKRILVLAGVSGTGKTRYRRRHLANYPYIDIADLYKEFPSLMRGAPAVITLSYRLHKLLGEHLVGTVVIEGYFLRGSESRATLITEAQAWGVPIHFMNFWDPLEVCEQRLRQAMENNEIASDDGEERIAMTKRCWRPRSTSTEENK